MNRAECLIFLKGEGVHTDLKYPPAEQGGEIAGKQKGIGTGQIDVEPLLLVQAVDDAFKAIAELYFVYEQKVGRVVGIVLIDIMIQDICIFQFLKLFQVELDPDDILFFNCLFNMLDKGVHKFGLARTTDTRYHLDIGRAHYIFELFKIGRKFFQ